MCCVCLSLIASSFLPSLFLSTCVIMHIYTALPYRTTELSNVFFCLQKRRGHGEHKGGLTGLFISESLPLPLLPTSPVPQCCLPPPPSPLPPPPLPPSLRHTGPHAGCQASLLPHHPPDSRLRLQLRGIRGNHPPGDCERLAVAGGQPHGDTGWAGN